MFIPATQRRLAVFDRRPYLASYMYHGLTPCSGALTGLHKH